MSRDYRLYLEDMVESANRIQKYAKGLSYDEFSRNGMAVDAVVRNLEIIGEAAKKVPTDVKKRHPEVEWRKVAGLRDIIAHEYFGINQVIIWDIVDNKIPKLKASIKAIVKAER